MDVGFVEANNNRDWMARDKIPDCGCPNRLLSILAISGRVMPSRPAQRPCVPGTGSRSAKGGQSWWDGDHDLTSGVVMLVECLRDTCRRRRFRDVKKRREKSQDSKDDRDIQWASFPATFTRLLPFWCFRPGVGPIDAPNLPTTCPLAELCRLSPELR